MPDDIERIRIRRWSTSDRPIISFRVSLPGDRDKLYFLSENIIQPALERVESVANVDIRGIYNKQLIITLRPELFYSSSINILDLINTIRNNNINISAGYVEDSKRFLVRVPGELKVAEQIMDLPLNEKGLKIKNVAKVTYDYPPKERFNRMNSRDSLSFSIYRASDANVVDVCKRVKTSVAALKETHPELKNMDVRFYRDQSEGILFSLRDLSISGIVGGILAVLVLLVFLRKLRSTIIIGMAIPMAVVFTFSLMYIYRVIFNVPLSINIISLSGLMMAVGMLVDNGVVVLENIFRLRQDKGFSPIDAAVKGSSEVALAVTASTLTTLVVFVSFTFIKASGFGRFMQDFALTISLALISSLLVSLTFIPLAGSRLLKGKTKKKAKWLQKLTTWYEKLITLTIKNWKTKLTTTMVALLILVSSIFLFLSIEQEYMPRSEEREVDFNVFMPGSFPLDSMISLFNQYEEIITQNKKELAMKNITTYYGVTNKRQGRYRGSVSLDLTDEGPTVTQIKERLKKLLPLQAGVSLEFGESRGRGGHHRGMRVELIGQDYGILASLVPMISEKLRTIEEIEDVSSDLEGGDVQLLVKVNRKKAESSGINTRSVARTIMSSISDRPIGKFKTENKEIDIILKLQKDDGFNEDDLKNLSFRSSGKQIPISAISNFTYRMGSMSINKENKKSKLRISLNTKSTGVMKISRKIREVMSGIQMPEGYSWSFGAGWRRFRDSQDSSSLAIWLALIFVYIIMASLFESFVHPFTILFTVPLALFGVAIFFKLKEITLNDVSRLGVLILMGIVVNNGIILIDHIRKLRQQGIAKDRAIIQGGKDRLRPILMTAITTIFGVLPLALPLLMPQFFPAGQGRAQMWAPISVAILGGLTTSTFFTLIILPTFYSIFDSTSSMVKRTFKLQSNNH